MRPYYSVRIVSLLVLGACIVFNWSLAIFFIIFFVVLSAMILGAIYIGWNFYIKSHNKGNNLQQVALTFDDGPCEETGSILDILKAHNVPATFFAVGKNVVAKPLIVKRWDDEGHLVGNHSFNHGNNFDWKPDYEMAKELKQTNFAIKTIIGKTPALFRPPYGVTNPALANAVKETKMQSIGWSIRSFDTKAKDPQQLLNKILKQVKGGDIILLHDKPAITKEILPELIRRIKEKGYTFVRADQLLDIQAYA